MCVMASWIMLVLFLYTHHSLLQLGVHVCVDPSLSVCLSVCLSACLSVCMLSLYSFAYNVCACNAHFIYGVVWPLRHVKWTYCMCSIVTCCVSLVMCRPVSLPSDGCFTSGDCSKIMR